KQAEEEKLRAVEAKRKQEEEAARKQAEEEKLRAVEAKRKKEEEAARKQAEEEKLRAVEAKAVPEARQTGEISPEVYRLRFGDEVEISVWGHADLNRSVPVREDGTFSFPLIGNVQAQDRTLREVEEEVRERLNRDYLVNPQVTAKLTGVKFSVFGEVSQPGSYPIEGTMDLLTAISLAGGITKFGSSSVEIIREKRGRKVVIQANVDRILKGREPNVEILPHDTVHVRRRIF
ncbi:MAG: polysaccharide biosynthesis/export family protein, partial [Candidatus Omnitrophica bacterium]|nr:polysaccharide biosynthesis/export family protein [Candidatus Omnitrophota bacterium]